MPAPVKEESTVLHLLIAILIVALVWALTGALGLPYIVSLIITILAALYLIGPRAGWWGGRPARY
jgi:hypothetical protein